MSKPKIEDVVEASMEDLIEAAREQCQILRENISDWCAEDDTREIEKAKNNLPYLNDLLGEINRRIKRDT